MSLLTSQTEDQQVVTTWTSTPDVNVSLWEVTIRGRCQMKWCDWMLVIRSRWCLNQNLSQRLTIAEQIVLGYQLAWLRSTRLWMRAQLGRFTSGDVWQAACFSAQFVQPPRDRSPHSCSICSVTQVGSLLSINPLHLHSRPGP